MDSGKASVFVLSAPSGSGKSTLARTLLNHFPQLAFSISATTRPPRPYEEDGKHYHFFSLDKFKALIEEDGFLEWEENYPGRFYGTLYTEIDRIHSEGKFPVFDVDVRGGLSIKEKYGEKALTIFIQAPSLKALKERLIHRGSDSEKDISERVTRAEEEMSYKEAFDHVIINDDLAQAKSDIIQLVGKHLPHIA